MSRQDLIVVDIETSGLDPHRHMILEVAAVNVCTGEELYFVPEPNDGEWLLKAEPKALKINRYFERGLFALQADFAQPASHYRALADMLDGNVIGGANPQFDESFLRVEMVNRQGFEPRWNYRVRDLATFYAGVKGINPAATPSFGEICTDLGIANEAPHTALGDARAEAEAFRKLISTSQAVLTGAG